MSLKKKFRLRSRYEAYRFRDFQFRNGLLETDDPKVVELFKSQSFFGPGAEVWLDDTQETDELVAKNGGDEKPSTVAKK